MNLLLVGEVKPLEMNIVAISESPRFRCKFDYRDNAASVYGQALYKTDTLEDEEAARGLLEVFRETPQ